MSRKPCSVPSSPCLPWTTGKTMSTWCARIQVSNEKSPLSDVASPSRIFALRSGPTKRPSRAMQIGTISMRSFGAAAAIERAERMETSCSGERPPKMRTVRVMRLIMADQVTGHRGQGTGGSRREDTTCPLSPVTCPLLRNRHASQQVLQIIITPADPRAEDDRRVVERVVDAAADEDHRRLR